MSLFTPQNSSGERSPPLHFGSRQQVSPVKPFAGFMSTPQSSSSFGTTHPATRSVKKPRGTPISWGRGDEIAFVKNGIHKSSAGKDEKVVVDVWDRYPDEMRRAIVHGHKAFLMLREWEEKQRMETSSLEESLAFFSEVSRQLRESYMSCFERIEVSDSPTAQSDLAKLHTAAAVWHLTEIMILFPSPLVANQMSSFAFTHFPRFNGDEFVQAQLEARQGNPLMLWTVIKEFVLRGDLLQAWTYLKHERSFTQALRNKSRQSSTESDDQIISLFEMLRSLLLEMPRMDDPRDHRLVFGAAEEDIQLWQAASFVVDAESDFAAYWQSWSDSVQRFTEDIDYKGLHLEPVLVRELLSILKVLQGDYEEISNIWRSSPDRSWVQLLATTLTFQTPTKRREDFHPLAIELVELERGQAEDQVTKILLACLDQNGVKVLTGLQTLIGDQFVEAHLAQILALAGAVETTLTIKNQNSDDSIAFENNEFLLGDLEVDLREYYIIRYAVSLGLGKMQTRGNSSFLSSWRLAADYLSSLERPVSIPQVQLGKYEPSRIIVPLGLLYMEQILERQFPVSDTQVSKLIRTCEMMDLPTDSIVRERVMFWWCHKGGRAKWQNNENSGLISFDGIANALRWSLRSKDNRVAHSIVNDLFTFSSLDVLDLLVESLGSNASMLTDGAMSEQGLLFLLEYQKLVKALSMASSKLRDMDECDTLRNEAVVQMEKIFESGCVPKRLYFPLLKKVLLWEVEDPDMLSRHPNILSNPPHFTMKQASMFQGFLEDPITLSVAKNTNALDSLSIMRLLLAQGLARSVVSCASHRSSK